MERDPQYGFTLIELLFTLVVAAILVGMAVPPFQAVMSRSTVSTSYNTLVGALDFTRQQAVVAGGNAIVCPSSDGSHCDASTHWERGWLVALDFDANGKPDAAPIVVQGALPDGVVVLSTAGRKRVRYHADGSAPGSNLSLIVCRHAEVGSARLVVVSNSGRPRQGRASAKQAQACAAG